MARSLSLYTFGVAAFAAIGTFLFGYDSGIAITIIAFPSWNVYMRIPSPALVGAVASAYAGGEAIGVLLQALVSDRLGRIRFLQLLCIITVIGTCIQTGAVDIAMFIAGRAVTGMGVGGLVVTVAVYLSEISPPGQRGFIAGFTGLGIAFGIMVASWVGVACIHAPEGNLQWRLAVALQIPWTPILFIGLCTFMPESPRILIRKGRIEEARLAFGKVHRGIDAVETQKEFALMRAQIEYERERERTSYLALFRQYHRRVLVAIAIGLMAILSGAPIVGYYQTILYKALGISNKTILILTGARGTLSFISVILINRYLIDQWGRRQLLLWGMGLSTAVLIYCAVMQKLFQDSDNEVGKGFVVLGIFAFAIFNGGILEAVCPMYTAETLPIAVRSKVMGLGGFIMFAVSVGLIEAAPEAFATIKQNYYYVFVGCTVVLWVVGYLCFPETKNRTLEEVAAAFGDKVVEVPASEGASETEVVVDGESKGEGMVKVDSVTVDDQEAGKTV